MTAMSPELLKAARHLGIWVFTLLAVGPLGLAQREPHWPNSGATVGGFETVHDYTLSPDTRTILGTGSHPGEVLLRLPSMTRQSVVELVRERSGRAPRRPRTFYAPIAWSQCSSKTG
jgi:hypothetical protein